MLAGLVPLGWREEQGLGLGLGLERWWGTEEQGEGQGAASAELSSCNGPGTALRGFHASLCPWGSHSSSKLSFTVPILELRKTKAQYQSPLTGSELPGGVTSPPADPVSSSANPG